MIALLVGLKLSCTYLTGKYFWIHVDSEAVATILNTGRSRDPLLQQCFREVALLCVQGQLIIKARHITGVQNRWPDMLSRWGLSRDYARNFRQGTQGLGLSRSLTNTDMFKFTHQW